MSLRIALLTTECAREHFKDYDCPVPFFGAAPEALIEGFAELSDVTVHVVACTQQPMAASPEKLAPNIWFHSLRVPKLGWMRSGYLGCIRAVRRKLAELQPDIVHGQGTERDCALEAIRSGFPNVVTIHGNMAELARLFRDPPFSFNWLTARCEDFVLPRTMGVFCNSAYTESLVRPRARRTWRVANPIRQAFFAPLTPPMRGGPPVILVVGVVSPRKRHVETLELARRLHRRGETVTFKFIGSCAGADAYQKEFLNKVAEAEREGYACWVGGKKCEDLIPLLGQANALLHFPTEEAFGLVVPEALARNLKFFGARLGGIVDIADGVELAELFAESDWNGLEEGVVRWLRAGAPQPAAAADEMKRRYAPRVIAARHLEIYREVLGQLPSLN